ncbi:MAG: Uma2 family endonuclease [Vicinamibacterales bacterium]
MAVAIRRHRFTADEYQQMGRAGILRPDVRVELIDGDVVTRMTIGPRHNAAVNRLNRLLMRLAGDAAIVQVQGSVRLDLYSEPEPDVVLLRPRDDDYASALPGPADILLVVEAADSSLEYDRIAKAALYARCGVAEYWLIDVVAEVVTRFREPVDGQYRRVEAVPAGMPFAPERLPACRLTAADIFGR